MDAVCAAYADGVLELERATLAGLAQTLHVGDDDVEGLRDLVAQRGIAKVGARHAVVHPATWLGLAFGHVGIDVIRHDGREGDDVMVGDLLDLVDLGHGEIGMRANPRGLLGGDAALPQLGLRFASEDLDLLPNVELVLERPDVAHLGQRVALDHPMIPFAWLVGALYCIGLLPLCAKEHQNVNSAKRQPGANVGSTMPKSRRS